MSQVNFFMTAIDDDVFAQMLLSRTDTAIIRGRFHATPRPSPIQGMPAFGADEWFEFVNTALASPITCSTQGLGEFEGMYLFDTYADPHIEFCRPYILEGVLHAGRIYCKTGHLATPEANRRYQAWYDGIASWLKRRYQKLDRVYWAGPDAAQRIRAGAPIFPPIVVGEPIARGGAA